MTAQPLTGRKVFAITATAFGVIIAVNLTLAVKAIGTFPGLEVKNSYVASQTFDADRAAQEALGWIVTADIADGALHLSIRDAEGRPVEASKIDATLGRATEIVDDRTPAFRYDGRDFVAPVDVGGGYWHLRLEAVAENGTLFRTRIPIHVRS